MARSPTSVSAHASARTPPARCAAGMIVEPSVSTAPTRNARRAGTSGANGWCTRVDGRAIVPTRGRARRRRSATPAVMPTRTSTHHGRRWSSSPRATGQRDIAEPCGALACAFRHHGPVDVWSGIGRRHGDDVRFGGSGGSGSAMCGQFVILGTTERPRIPTTTGEPPCAHSAAPRLHLNPGEFVRRRGRSHSPAQGATRWFRTRGSVSSAGPIRVTGPAGRRRRPQGTNSRHSH